MIALRNLLTSARPLRITAKIESALCVGAGGSSGSLADKAIVRTADGQLLIPGSQLKGRLRHECEKLARGLDWKVCNSPRAETMCPQRSGLEETEEGQFRQQYPQQGTFTDGRPRHHCLICQIFGNPALPSRILVDDLICTVETEVEPEVLRPGVTLSRTRRTAEDRKLFFLETSPANIALPFVGQIHFLPGLPPAAPTLILAGLHHIHALGGSKSAGLGWLQWQFEGISIPSEAWKDLQPGARKP